MQSFYNPIQNAEDNDNLACAAKTIVSDAHLDPDVATAIRLSLGHDASKSAKDTQAAAHSTTTVIADANNVEGNDPHTAAATCTSLGLDASGPAHDCDTLACVAKTRVADAHLDPDVATPIRSKDSIQESLIGTWKYHRERFGDDARFAISRSTSGHLLFNEDKWNGFLKIDEKLSEPWYSADFKLGTIRLKPKDGTVVSQFRKKRSDKWGKEVVGLKCTNPGYGKAGQPKDMRLLHNKCDQLEKGTYISDECLIEESKVTTAPATDLRAAFGVAQGAYFVQGTSTSGTDVKFLIRLEAGAKCHIEQASVGKADPALAWTDDGTYTESLGEGGKVESIVFHGCQRSMEFKVEKAEQCHYLVCEGIRCSFLFGALENELKVTMRMVEGVEQVEASAVTDPVYADTFISYSLEQVVNDFKKLNLDPSKRETYLSDADFHGHFGVDKATFASQAKWNQIQKKKELNLF